MANDNSVSAPEFMIRGDVNSNLESDIVEASKSKNSDLREVERSVELYAGDKSVGKTANSAIGIEREFSHDVSENHTLHTTNSNSARNEQPNLILNSNGHGPIVAHYQAGSDIVTVNKIKHGAVNYPQHGTFQNSARMKSNDLPGYDSNHTPPTTSLLGPRKMDHDVTGTACEMGKYFYDIACKDTEFSGLNSGNGFCDAVQTPTKEKDVSSCDAATHHTSVDSAANTARVLCNPATAIMDVPGIPSDPSTAPMTVNSGVDTVDDPLHLTTNPVGIKSEVDLAGVVHNPTNPTVNPMIFNSKDDAAYYPQNSQTTTLNLNFIADSDCNPHSPTTAPVGSISVIGDVGTPTITPSSTTSGVDSVETGDSPTTASLFSEGDFDVTPCSPTPAPLGNVSVMDNAESPMTASVTPYIGVNTTSLPYNLATTPVSMNSEVDLEYHGFTSSVPRPSVRSFLSFPSSTQAGSRLDGIDVRVEVSMKQLRKSLSGSSISSFATESTLTDFCRICHCGGDAELGSIIAPCRCRGSLRYVHQACLQEWIKSSDSKQCELCGYRFVMDAKLKPLHKWKKLSMSKAEHRKLVCSVLFHIVAIICVIWSLYVLIESTAKEVNDGELQWPFWLKLAVVAVGFGGGLVFMYVQCKAYVQLWERLKAFNRIIYIKNNPMLDSNTPRENVDGGARDMRESVGSLESSDRQQNSTVSNEQVTCAQSSCVNYRPLTDQATM